MKTVALVLIFAAVVYGAVIDTTFCDDEHCSVNCHTQSVPAGDCIPIEGTPYLTRSECEGATVRTEVYVATCARETLVHTQISPVDTCLPGDNKDSYSVKCSNAKASAKSLPLRGAVAAVIAKRKAMKKRSDFQLSCTDCTPEGSVSTGRQVTCPSDTGDIKITGTGSVTEEVGEGSYYGLQMTYLGIPVSSSEGSACGESLVQLPLNIGVVQLSMFQCPATGPYTTSATIPLEGEGLPPGTLTGHLEVYTAAHKMIYCVDITASSTVTAAQRQNVTNFRNSLLKKRH